MTKTKTTTEYGIKYPEDQWPQMTIKPDAHGMRWYPGETRSAVESLVYAGRVLYSHEVSEPVRVVTEPTAPGSVIRAEMQFSVGPTLLMRTTRMDYPWVGVTSRDHEGSCFNSNAWHSFEVVFDAGA